MVINAAGPWVDRVARNAGVDVPLRLRKGVHLVYRNHLALSPERLGLLLEAEDRERYVFVIPGADGSTLVGPTDTPTPEGPDALSASAEDKRYLLASVRAYFPDFPDSFDGVSVGARPILGQAGSEKYLSREFEIIDHGARDGVPGLVTAAGGKMSDFRLMAEAAVDATARLLGMSALSRTAHETLAGEPLDAAPDRRPPGALLKNFLRRHPRWREAHAWAYLVGGYARHWARKLAPANAVTAEAVWSHYR
jgi:glycerol-3-phosphate dehydrogenase